MKIYDISQEVFACEVYPGDLSPEKEEVLRMKSGSLYNLTNLHMCTHNGTHIDAPFHFFEDGKTIAELSLEKMIGPAYVHCHNGELTAKDAGYILNKAASFSNDAAKRILLKGTAVITEEAATIFASVPIDLIGVESQSAGPEEAPMAVHKILLGKEIILLEGIRLKDVEDGEYFLHAAPLSLDGSDGAPCRATLIGR